MADNTVEISNVQGPRGVASEATLLMLLDAMKAMTGNSSQQAKVQELYTKAQKVGTTETKRSGSAIKNLGTAALDTTKAFVAGARRTEEFAEALMGGTNAVTRFFGYMDSNIDMFRSLSSVGASFNNSMIDMIAASANSAMEMGDFTNFVRTNSESIRLLSGTVSQGAQAFGEFSKNLRNSDTGYQLMTMGFTIEDLNDGLVSYIDLQTNLGRRELLRTQNVGMATAEYLEDLDALAKVTGRSREELAGLTRQVSTDSRVRALAARATQEGADNLTKNLALATSAVPGMAESFMNIASGIPIDDLSKALETGAGSAGRALADLMENAENLDTDEFASQFSRLAPQVADFLQEAYEPTQLAAMKMQGGVVGAIAELAGFGAQLDRSAMMNMEEAREQAAQQNRLTGIFGNFENAVISARRFLVDLFLDSKLASALRNLGETLGNMIGGVGTGTFQGFGSMLSDIASKVLDTLGGFVQWVDDDLNSEDSKIRSALTTFGEKLSEAANAVKNWFSAFQADVEEQGLMNTIKERFTALADRVKEYIMDLFLGEVQTEPGGPERGTRQGGLFQKVSTSIVEMFNNLSSNTTIIDRISTAFSDFLNNNTVIESMKESVKKMTNTALDTVETKLRDILGMSETETFAQKIDSMIESMTNTVIDVFNRRIPELMQTIINSAKSVVGGGTATTTSIETGAPVADGIVSSLAQMAGIDAFSARIDPLQFYGQMQRAGGIVGLQELEDRRQTKGYLNTVYGELQGTGVDAATARQQIRDSLRKYITDNYNDAAQASMLEYLEGPLEKFISELPEYNTGTNGFQNFGSGSLATLHGAEAVVPRNTPAGELLQAFYDSQNASSSGSSSTSQSTIVEKLNELNTSMRAMVDLMVTQNRTSGRQLQAVRASSTDLYRSTGR